MSLGLRPAALTPKNLKDFEKGLQLFRFPLLVFFLNDEITLILLLNFDLFSSLSSAGLIKEAPGLPEPSEKPIQTLFLHQNY